MTTLSTDLITQEPQLQELSPASERLAGDLILEREANWRNAPHDNSSGFGPGSEEARRNTPPLPAQVEEEVRGNGYPGQDANLTQSPETTRATFPITNAEYVQQIENWTCGPAVYRMARKVLRLPEITDEQAVLATNANDLVGTRNASLVKLFNELVEKGIEVRTGCITTTEAEREESGKVTDDDLLLLTRLLKDGYTIIIHFRDPDGEGHFGIVSAINLKAIELADPYYGRVSVLPLEKLDWRGGFDDSDTSKFFVAVRRVD